VLPGIYLSSRRNIPVTNGISGQNPCRIIIYGFEVLTAVKMSMLFFWVVTPCRLVRRYHRFGLSLLPSLTLKMEVCSSETFIYNQETTRCNTSTLHLSSQFCVSPTESTYWFHFILKIKRKNFPKVIKIPYIRNGEWRVITSMRIVFWNIYLDNLFRSNV
jgi:hypothetical protein